MLLFEVSPNISAGVTTNVPILKSEVITSSAKTTWEFAKAQCTAISIPHFACVVVATLIFALSFVVFPASNSRVSLLDRVSSAWLAEFAANPQTSTDSLIEP